MNQLVTKERSASTVRNTWLKATNAVYGWGQKAKKVGRNPFAEIFITVPRSRRYRPKYFYEQERTTILNAASAITVTTKPDMAAKRWVPWLLYYTGARPQDMTQLRGVDVERMDTVWTFNLTPEAGTIKGGHARRVPIHFRT